MKPVWAITGASGFIGRSLEQRLRRHAYEIRGLARRAPESWIIAGDVGDREKLPKLVTGATVVVHLAAWVHKPARSKTDIAECWRVNRDATIALLDAVESYARDAFVVFLSTGNVYALSSEPLTETSPLAPRTAYGESKLAAERALLERVKSGRIRGVVLRPGLVIGPGSPGNFGRIVAAIRRRVFPMIRGGGQRKTVVPLSVLLDAIVRIAAAPEAFNGEVFNVAAGAPLTIAEIGRFIGDALGIRPLRVSLPRWPLLQLARLGDVIAGRLYSRLPPLQQIVETYSTDFVLDDERLRRLIPLSPIDLRAAIAEAVRPSS